MEQPYLRRRGRDGGGKRQELSGIEVARGPEQADRID
jgi:hypothetical protein